MREMASRRRETSASPEKLSLRQQIEKNVESVRTEEAKRARAADGKFTKLDGAAETPATEKFRSLKANAQPEASKAVGPPSWMVCGVKSVYPSKPGRSPVKREAEEEVSKGFKEYRRKPLNFRKSRRF
jgi:hypothetical protein